MEKNSNSNGGVTTSSDFVLRWGNRKRLRCMKFQVKDRDNNHDPNPSGPGSQSILRSTTVRVDRRTSDSIKDHAPQPSYRNATANNNDDGSGKTSNGVNLNSTNNNGLLNFRHPASPCWLGINNP